MSIPQISGSWTDVLCGRSSTGGASSMGFRDALRSLASDESRLERASTRSGASLSTEDLLKLQADTYRYSQSLDVVSRTIDRGANAIKQVIQTGQT